MQQITISYAGPDEIVEVKDYPKFKERADWKRQHADLDHRCFCAFRTLYLPGFPN